MFKYVRKELLLTGAFFAAIVLSGCVTDPVPKSYTGAVANVRDSMKRCGNNCIDLFFVSKIDDRNIEESLHKTLADNAGHGLDMQSIIIDRDVPATEETFTIVGRTHYTIPLLEMANKVFEVSGKTRFTPKPNEIYVVRGELRDDYSAVWIEEAYTGTVVGQKVEVNGSTALGLLQE